MKAHQGCNKDSVPAEAGAETFLLDIQMNIYLHHLRGPATKACVSSSTIH